MSGLCREALLADFPGKLWLDVLSKADLLQVDFDAADAMRHSGNETASNVTANTQATQQALSQSNNDTDSLHEGMTQQQNPARHLQHHTVHDSNVGRNDKQEAVDQCEGAEDAAAAAENTPVAAAGVQQGEEQHNHLSAKGSLVSQQPESYRPQGQGAEEDCSSSDAQLSDHDTPAADATASHSNDVSSLSVAAQVALMLPNAVRISSVTQFGIQQLQQDVTKLLAKQLEADTDLQTSDVPA